MERFHYLKVGLGLVLAFVGVKMVISGWYMIPIHAALGVVCAILGLSIAASLLSRPVRARLPVDRHEDDKHSPPCPEEAVP
jgi:predicted tellurium resistance membrane protein TerC